MQAIAVGAPLADRLNRDFPLAARAGSLEPNAPAAQLSDAVALESGDARVVLRGSAKDVAVLRTGSRDALILENEAAARRIAYDVVRMEGIEAIVGDGRGGVRFLNERGTQAKPFGIGRALLIDSTGRPAFARWSIEKNRISLRVTDRALRYPVAVVYSTGADFQQQPAFAKTRRFVAQDHAAGTLAGVVTSGTAPVPDALLFIYNSIGELIEFAVTDAAGAFSVSLEAGSYTLLTFASGYQEELYNDIPCPSFSCDPSTGNLIGITAAATTSISINLPATLGRISGTITSTANVPLPGVLAIIYNSGGNPVTAVEADANGAYELVLEPGTYYVASRNDIYAGLVDQLFNGNDCTGCNPTTGTPLVLSSGTMAAGTNLVLKTNGGRIAGNVKDADNSEPVAFEDVVIYNSLGKAVSYGTTDAAGNYTNVHGLATGSYYAVASAFLYESELFDNINCAAGCVPTSGTAINVNLGATRNNVDFTLKADSNRVSGRVYGAANNVGLPDVIVHFYNAQGTLVAGATALSDGSYDIRLPSAGTYYAKTNNMVHAGYIDQLYNGINCSSCDPTTGTAITVTANARVTGIDFPLANNGGAISGRVTNANSSAPLENATVVIYGPTGIEVTYGTTDANGNYTSFHGLAAGNYFAIAYATGFDPKIYNNIPCSAPCDPTIGTSIAVAAGTTTTGINFSVGGAVATISGTVKTSNNNTPIGGVTVQIYNSSGALVGGAISDGTDGSYEAQLGASGTYYAVTNNEAGYFEELYNNISCANGCNPTTGTAITATLGQNTPNINFTLEAMPVVCPIINFEPESLADGVYNVPYSVQIIASGGQAPHTYSISSGTLPPGMTLSTSGLLSGTPSAAGTYVFTVLAKDSTGTGETQGTQCTGTKTYTLIIQKANPVLTWADPAAITYGTALGASQLNATANVSGAFVYTPAAGTILDAGTHTLSVAFTPADTANYNNASDTATLVVLKANQTVNWSNPASIVYGTPLGATQLNATVTVPGPSPHGALTYNPAAGTVLNAGTHTLNVSVAGTNNYNPATASVQLVVLKATPVFSNLSAPSIVVGTATATVSGKIAAPTAIPPGSVSITINGVTQSAAIAADGTFSATFNTASLAVATYPIAFSYAGDANFNPATGSSTLRVSYAFTGGPQANQPSNSGSTIPFRISLVNAAGTNVSVASIPVTATDVRLASGGASISLASLGNPNGSFDFQNASGGSYRYNLQTTGLASGTYVLRFTVGGDPYLYEVTFSIK